MQQCSLNDLVELKGAFMPEVECNEKPPKRALQYPGLQYAALRKPIFVNVERWRQRPVRTGKYL
jgi:hypothetical protein